MPPTEEEMKAAQAEAEAAKAKEHEASAKADAEAGEKLDKVLEALDSLSSRMDAYEEEEGKRHEGEDEAEGEQGEEKHDAEGETPEEMEEEQEEEEEPETSGAGDAEEGEEDKGEMPEEIKKHMEEQKADSDDIRARIAAVEKKLPKQISDADYAAMADAQAKADEVFQAFGDAAPRPLDGESLILYRRRLARTLQKHSPDWKEVDLVAIADSNAFGIAEKRIYADAMYAAMHPVDLPAGVLRTITRQRFPHQILEYAGEPRSWMDDIAHPGGTRQYVTQINRPNQGSMN